ncbi:ribosome small subunit-dependent GTPase A [Spiroplasma endosymbiont of Amphibalanus improvisus]|uniref:ribosome small subunit-dependent GTPase A n=1 Tax=Spiroplasma endosymbiont of Amphibalanus improvisus TaxID=3066327 RepID=UPI00313F1AFF
MIIKKGFVISLSGDYFFVLIDEVKYLCRLKGLLKKDDANKVIVGDFVDVQIDYEQKTGVISKIYKRKNELKHPKIANIDQIVIIVPFKEPDFNSFLLNKFIWSLEFNSFKPLICFSKRDLIEDADNLISVIQDYKDLGFTVSVISNKLKDSPSWEEFQSHLNNKISVFTGQSGAGKSTTINNLLNDEIIKTKEISRKSKRGKNTTTAINLYMLNNGIIADTPGFSSFDFNDLNLTTISSFIFKKSNFEFNCKFSNCLHLTENKCFIKWSVENNKIPRFYYNDYVKLIDILKTNRG